MITLTPSTWTSIRLVSAPIPLSSMPLFGRVLWRRRASSLGRRRASRTRAVATDVRPFFVSFHFRDISGPGDWVFTVDVSRARAGVCAPSLTSICSHVSTQDLVCVEQ
ncbi:hypothetical protein B0H12DRAFT_1134819 [Mycena haematopus]|nr:hypothetical protein B0H12DRAFT_1134819 [Mycena haematopus]